MVDPGPWSAYANQDEQLEERVSYSGRISTVESTAITNMFDCLRELVMVDKVQQLKLTTSNDDFNHIYDGHIPASILP